MTSLMEIRARIDRASAPADRLIQGLWSVDCLFGPKNNGRIFNYKFILSQTTGLGCAYSLREHYDTEYLHNLIGKDFFTQDITDTALLVSLYDSIYGKLYITEPAYSQTMTDTAEAKMEWRTELVLKEAKNLLGEVKGKKIVNVGVVGDMIKKFAEEGCNIIGSDFDETIIGQKMFGLADIYSGEKTLDLIASSDLAIVTGMTIATETIDDILACCRETGTKLVIYSETGANLAPFYIEKGVDAYVSEMFPFYIFNGASTIHVFRKKV